MGRCVKCFRKGPTNWQGFCNACQIEGSDLSFFDKFSGPLDKTWFGKAFNFVLLSIWHLICLNMFCALFTNKFDYSLFPIISSYKLLSPAGIIYSLVVLFQLSQYFIFNNVRSLKKLSTYFSIIFLVILPLFFVVVAFFFSKNGISLV